MAVYYDKRNHVWVARVSFHGRQKHVGHFATEAEARVAEHAVKPPPPPRPRWIMEDCGHSTPCWIWGGAIRKDGYGAARSDGRSWLAHRLVYTEQVGAVDATLTLDHLCRVRACVNPAHLEPVTGGENVRRGLSTKLTDHDVRAIRASTDTFQALSVRYGVGQTQIHGIKARTRRADVPEMEAA